MPRSPKRRPEPATKSFTVLDTKTSSVSASAATRAPTCRVATNNEYGGQLLPFEKRSAEPSRPGRWTNSWYHLIWYVAGR